VISFHPLSCKKAAKIQKMQQIEKKVDAPKTHLIMQVKGVPKNVHYLITFYKIKFQQSALLTFEKSLVDRLFEKYKIMEEVVKRTEDILSFFNQLVKKQINLNFNLLIIVC